MKIAVAFGNRVAPPEPPPARVWSAQQSAVFDWGRVGKGNLVVRARAGTGKTTTIVEMLSHVAERQVLLCAFNKAIAKELQARVVGKVECKTLHGLGFKYVRRAWGASVGVDERDERATGLTAAGIAWVLSQRPVVGAPDPDVVRLITKLHTLCREQIPFVALATPGEAGRACLEIEMVMAKHNLMPDDEAEVAWDIAAITGATLAAMRRAMVKCDAIDFADMVFLPLACNLARPWFDMVVVDEAQDMTAAQLELARRACRRTGRMVVVGDDRQAIYGFRGADSDGIDRMKTELKATELTLTATRRCPIAVVKLAQVIVPDFTNVDGAPTGEVMRRDGERMMDEATPDDFVVSRTNAPLIRICLGFLRRGVRAKVKGREVGKGVMKLIRTVGKQGLPTLPAKLEEYVARECEKASSLKTEEAIAARREFIRDQADVVLALCEDAADVAEVLSRCENLFADEPGAGVITCSTTHRVKGLETDRVWMLEGTFRLGKGLEEDNLRYVAMTRTKNTLVLVSGYK